MLPTDILLPVLVHVGLVFGVLFSTAIGRFQAIATGEVNPRHIALDDSGWPERLRKKGNNYRNQFELPVLFYALVAFLLITQKADLVEVVLAWLFVLTRLVHTFIHLGSNQVLRRGQVFAAGVFILAVMWIWFGLRLYLLG